MSNLTDLLPAGAGGKQVSFVASGTLSSGQAVILNSNGTVSAPTNQSNSISAPASLQNDIDATATIYDASEDRFVTAFRNRLSSNRLEVRAGSLSGTTITWGTTQTSGNCGDSNVRIAGDNNGGFVVLFENSSDGQQYAVAGTVSGSTITLGTASKFSTDTYGLKDVAYDANSGKYVITFIDNTNSLYGTAVVATVTGTSISFGSNIVFDSNSNTNAMRCTYDSNNQKIVAVDSRTGRFTGFIGTVSGTSTSWTSAFDVVSQGRPKTFGGTDVSAITYAPDQDAVVFVFCDNDNSERGTVCVGSLTSTTITWGAVTVIDSSDKMQELGITYDTVAKKAVIPVRYGDTAATGRYITATISGNSASFGFLTQFESGEIQGVSAAFSTAALKTAIAYSDEGESDNGKYVVQANAIQNYTDFIGITDAAISDTASGSVTIKGGISTNVTGLTPNQTYYVQANGTLSTTASDVLAGKALSSTSINLDYTT